MQKKTGHIAPVCCSRVVNKTADTSKGVAAGGKHNHQYGPKRQSCRQNKFSTVNSSESDELSLQQIFVTGVNPSDPIQVQVKVDNFSLFSMVVDTAEFL